MKKQKEKSEVNIGDSLNLEIIKALSSNPEVYKGTAQDAAKLPKLAQQILDEWIESMIEKI